MPSNKPIAGTVVRSVFDAVVRFCRSCDSDEMAGMQALRVAVGMGDPRLVPGVRSGLRFSGQSALH